MFLPKGGEAGKSFTMLNLTRNRPPKYGVSSGPSMIASTDVISLSSRIIWTPSNGSCFKFCTSLARILISWGLRFSTLDTMIGKIWRVWRLIFQNLQISFLFQKKKWPRLSVRKFFRYLMVDRMLSPLLLIWKHGMFFVW